MRKEIMEFENACYDVILNESSFITKHTPLSEILHSFYHHHHTHHMF